MNQTELKKMAAEAALKFVVPDSIIGIGTGSTVNIFIEALAKIKQTIEGAVASSVASEKLLKQHGISVFDLNVVDHVEVYIDGADEVNRHQQLIKGGGGALTREKILANACDKFICIADQSKLQTKLGTFPVAVEVIPMARSYVGRQIVKLGGDPEYREGFTTDNGNIILDIYNLDIMEPIKLEQQLNNIAGVVSNGIFAMRGADIVLLGTDQGLIELK